ncbi:MAG: hypothetical protein ACRDPD_02735 [Streptosporangiaceae bacterium]
MSDDPALRQQVNHLEGIVRALQRSVKDLRSQLDDALGRIATLENGTEPGPGPEDSYPADPREYGEQWPNWPRSASDV